MPHDLTAILTAIIHIGIGVLIGIPIGIVFARPGNPFRGTRK